MAKYRIWTLNNATDMLEDRVDKLKKELESMGHEISFGDRTQFNIIESDFPGFQLMAEEGDRDEYFVPIALKCLGKHGPYLLKDIDNEAAENLYNSLKNDEIYSNPDILNKYWSINDSFDHYPYLKMNTKDGMGLYNILEESSGDIDGNILIGYSQGGLVARYLAVLDEHIFKKNLIHGIITIGSPNYGSPLSNPNNNDSVISGIIASAVSILVKKKEQNNLIHTLNELKGFNADDISMIIEALIDDINCDKSLTDREKKSRSRPLYTLKKWFTGLQSSISVFTVFNDLKITDLDSELYTPLKLTYLYPLRRIRYGAVVHTDNDPNRLIKEALGFWKGIFFTLLTRKGRVNMAGRNYSLEVMEEIGLNQDSLASTFNKKYTEGIEGELEPYSHDFVIPSYSMFLPDFGGDNFLGNHINNRANHLSGSNVRVNREFTYKRVVEMLKAMLRE